MINANMRLYNYFTLGGKDAYGQQIIPSIDAVPAGQIKMAISLTSQSVQDNINYKGAQYLGLTHAPIDDTYIIQFGDKRLKVLYINAFGRIKQVFMEGID